MENAEDTSIENQDAGEWPCGEERDIFSKKKYLENFKADFLESKINDLKEIFSEEEREEIGLKFSFVYDETLEFLLNGLKDKNIDDNYQLGIICSSVKLGMEVFLEMDQQGFYLAVNTKTLASKDNIVEREEKIEQVVKKIKGFLNS